MKTRASAGFSLIEILVAVALLGAVLLSLNVFVFSMGEIWGRGSEQRLFDQHVRAVTRHVDAMLRRAVIAGTTNTEAVAPEEIRTESGSTEPLLTFELPAGDRTLPWPEKPLPDVVCSLETRDGRDGRGLYLYWHSRLETRFEDDPPRATLLSPFATSMNYDYYDTDARVWRNQTRPQKDSQGRWLTPNRVILRFKHGKLEAETIIVLPTASAALPAF